MKDSNIGSILEIMKKECKIFEEMIFLAKKKPNIIIKREIEELEIITKVENKMAVELEKLEEERFNKVVYVFENMKVKVEKQDLMTLASILENKESELMIEYREKMLSLINELKKENEINVKLINNSMEYVDFLINVVTNGDNSADNNYSDSGKLSDNGIQKRMFDLKL
jgi:flagellar biosynthesis/type III secretory pathway chaperone